MDSQLIATSLSKNVYRSMVYHCIHVLHLVSDLGLNFMG